MLPEFHERLVEAAAQMRQAGTYKAFEHIASPMDALVRMEDRGEVLVLSSNNYLGLANHPEVIAAGQQALAEYGAGTASVRFICGTFTIHRELETELARFFGTEAALTYVSCWNANTGAVPALVGPDDALLSDELNHASLIDACRLASKTPRLVYKHADMADLAAKLTEAADARNRLILTDGVFSMEGDLAPLADIVDLAEKHGAAVLVDDSHGTGVAGPTGRGVAEHFGVADRVDLYTSTLGKALGGAAGGFVASTQAVIDHLSQVSRPQIFSNALPPTVAASALAALRVLIREPERVRRLHEVARQLRAGLADRGFNPRPGRSGIIPIILGETARAIRFSRMLLERGVFVTGFGYPVVPEGSARVRVQASAALSDAHVSRALDAFSQVGRDLGVI
jgi:glycine C-acetyltransferase